MVKTHFVEPGASRVSNLKQKNCVARAAIRGSFTILPNMKDGKASPSLFERALDIIFVFFGN